MNRDIVIASNNKDKIKEVQEILNDYNIISIGELGIKINVKEDKDTFEANAIKKAKSIAKKINGEMCIADDSGIEIQYLNGFPGVKTKRWLEGTDRERNLAILKKLEGIPKKERRVTFITAIALSDGVFTISAVSNIEGYIANTIRGKNGFGFDEIFELENGKTLAELSEEEKNNISSRRKALEQIKSKLLEK